MGLSCHDIDVALNSVSGADFAECVRAFVVEHLCDPSILGHHGHVAIIKSNPEKSKHLETATVRIFNIDVDFVNLRNETYQSGSRIPTIVTCDPVTIADGIRLLARLLKTRVAEILPSTLCFTIFIRAKLKIIWAKCVRAYRVVDDLIAGIGRLARWNSANSSSAGSNVS